MMLVLAIISWIWQQNSGNQNKNKQVGLYQLLYSKGFYTAKEKNQQVEKCNLWNWRKYLQTIYPTMA